MSSVDSVLKDIRNKRIAPVYLIHGDEPYYLDRIADELEKVVVPVAERGFNQFVLFGKDADVGAVLNYARRYPFMAERQLVLVKEAQQIGGIKDKSGQQLLEGYAMEPLASTVLAIFHNEPLDERKAWVKAFGSKGVLVNAKKMYDNKLVDWVGEYCRGRGTKISPKACQMLVDAIGNDLKRMAGEVDKMLLNLRVDEEISATTVERFVGISKEYNVFELQKAITQRDVLKANRIVDYFGQNAKDNPLVVILAQLFQYFSKVLLVQASKDQSERGLAPVLGVNPFFVKDYLSAARTFPLVKVADIIHAIRRADAQAKGIDTATLSEGDILKELLFAILH
ncbi:DNA polymerase III subunit delta [Fibrella aquatilis]|uniref:DNA polymerase III subunit delta n=1 Tax=Fibrella aquatilis TaxID=2817059 RepID=A0A939JX09_9BACT|nr:DNA polymerase III subunit delta [Fibrella aquatilis]MBO0930549.1 DNA polymerase III subunit delta [Fibrella aquatilis]